MSLPRSRTQAPSVRISCASYQGGSDYSLYHLGLASKAHSSLQAAPDRHCSSQAHSVDPGKDFGPSENRDLIRILIHSFPIIISISCCRLGR